MRKLVLIIQCISVAAFAGETLDVCEGEASETKNNYVMITSSANWEANIQGKVIQQPQFQRYIIEGVGVAVDSKNPDRVERKYKLIVSTRGINPLTRNAEFFIDGKAQGEGLVLDPVITVITSEEPRPKGYVRTVRCGTIEEIEN